MIGALKKAIQADVSRETFARLEDYVQLVIDANQHQNLVSKSTIASIWDRHIVDSAQLARYVRAGSSIVDIGSGAGLPGIVLAILTNQLVTLVEPRALRATFLRDTARELNLDQVEIIHGKAGAARGSYDTITARAVAPATELFAMTHHLAHAGTTYLFPKGRSATSELEVVRGAWQGDFRLEPSVTSDEASILVASRVRPRGKR